MFSMLCHCRYWSCDDCDSVSPEHLLHRDSSMGPVLSGHGLQLRAALGPLQQLLEHMEVSTLTKPVCQPFHILRNLSAFKPCIAHFLFILKYYGIITFYRISMVSNQKDVKSLIMACCHCRKMTISCYIYHWRLSVGDREKEIETGETDG